ncbi:MAG: NTP transferase domain-containing protein [Aristaeellaceae bacterium]
MSSLAGIVLAAGLSSRMGAFKPLMEVDGRAMILRVIDGMKGAGASPVVVVTGHRRVELEAALSGEGVEFAFNPDYAVTQQLESLRVGLAAVAGRAERIMISPADVPLVSPATIARLASTPGDFVRPVWQGEVGHPVFLSSAFIPYLMAYDGPGGLRGAMERHPACNLRSVDCDDRGTVLDNDTRADFDRLLAWREKQAGQRR